MTPDDFQVLEAFLCKSKSHRWIQENIMKIPAPLRGGGYQAMEVLHKYSVKGSLKGSLSGVDVTPENICQLINEATSFTEENSLEKNYIEGALTSRLVNSYERNTRARLKCLAHHGFKCIACGFDFEKHYGKIGSGYIEVHHLVPLSSLKAEYTVDPIKDLIPLCANCHAMVHRTKPALSLEEIKSMILKK